MSAHADLPCHLGKEVVLRQGETSAILMEAVPLYTHPAPGSFGLVALSLQSPGKGQVPAQGQRVRFGPP